MLMEQTCRRAPNAGLERSRDLLRGLAAAKKADHTLVEGLRAGALVAAVDVERKVRGDRAPALPGDGGPAITRQRGRP